MKRNRYILFAFRFVVGGVFIWSGMLKILHPLGFAQNVAAYELFPKWMVILVAASLPWVEATVGLLLVVGLFRRAAALVACGMLAAFILLVSVTMVRGLSLTCGCFGSFSGKVGWKLLGQDVILLLMSLVVLFSRSAELTLDGKWRPSAKEI